jgi:hypothetical protein
MSNDLIERMRTVIRIFFNKDPRFQVSVGGNPHAVDRMLDDARATLAEAEKLGPAERRTWWVDGEAKYDYWRIPIANTQDDSIPDIPGSQ